jgi:hypothetical protein
MSYVSITNRGDYLSPHYLAEVLPRDLAKKTSLRTRWAERDKAGERTPVKGMRGLRREYFDARLSLQESSESSQFRQKELKEQETKKVSDLNGSVLRALGFAAASQVLTVGRAGEPFEVPVAYSGQNVLAVDCAWATDTDAAFDADGGGRLLATLELSSREKLESGAKLARWLFAADEPPRYVLLLHGGVIVLADRLTWAEGRYLAVSLDTALERVDNAELELIAALFSADALQPPAEGGEEPLAAFVDGSRQHAVGVSAELREGLRESVQIIANEVLDRLGAQGVDDPARIYDGNLAKDLGRQSLRYLYRILFLLYAEARPELGILPVDDEDYMAGYSMARLGELIARRLGGEEARESFHLYESLAVLFRMVNNGHDNPGDGEGLQFEAMKADLFDPTRTKLIGRLVDPAHDIESVESEKGGPLSYDTRLRDGALYQVLRRLMLSKGRGAGRGGRRERTERGGFISYAQLGISQLGAVYEGLMSYTGFIATEELYEVAKPGKDGKGGDPTGGSWMIPASKVPDYADDVFVKVRDENGFHTGERVRYAPGSFVYRLAGRDRQTSASYYTPQSLTSVTVQLALEQRVKEQENAEDGSKVTANEVLRWRICEPALGSGAFLNEAIDQTAALYLKLREEETDDRLEPEERALALQRVKAYIALHNCYGVDLNETAVELAEVSIWLNVMHRGLQAPWFGLHLVRGNSLIGAGRRFYPAHALAKGQWLKTAPEDHQFSAGEIPSGHVHHFLLPAAGWGAVAAEKEAKELALEQAKQLAAWRKQLQKSPSDRRTAGHKLSQVQRLQALSARAEYLWNLVIERLRISEREISRPINLWGAENLPHAQEAIPRDQIVEDLTTPGTPYWRLKTVMDAWCALWFWPLDKIDLLDGTAGVYKSTSPTITPQAEEKPAPVPEPAAVDPDPNFPVIWEMDSLFGETPRQLTLADAASKKPRLAKRNVTHRSPVPLANLDDWLDFAESLLGRQDIKEGTLGRTWNNLTELGEHEDEIQDAVHMDMDSFMRVAERFPWLKTAEEIAAAQGFFHWELRFASVFREGGFDLQVGNPPWVRPRWDEDSVLAESDPWFQLVENAGAVEHEQRKVQLLAVPSARDFFIDELTRQSSVVEFYGSHATYELMVGTQPDLYRVFMLRVWKNLSRRGTAGLIHPDSHLTGSHEARLRSATYAHLRLHAHFQNRRLIFPDVDWNKQFGMHVYGSARQVSFIHLSWLFDPGTLISSLVHDGPDEVPGIKYERTWDLRPSKKRIVEVNLDTLTRWRSLSGDFEIPIQEVKLLYPVSTDEARAIGALAQIERRLGDMRPEITRGYDEANAKKSGLIRWDTSDPGDWSEVILRGPQFNIATPIAKRPPNTKHTDKPVDLNLLGEATVPSTDYRRATDLAVYQDAQDLWFEERRRYTEFYRVAWREMIPASTERSLFPALVPPGPAHIHGVRSMALASNRHTAMIAGFWATIPLDYALRVGGHGHLDVADARMMPAPDVDHPLSESMLLRAMRLNCLTSVYGSLWNELYRDTWKRDEWAVIWPELKPLQSVSPKWDRDTPLRKERERRSALVELDVVAAIMLRLTADELVALYKSRFPQLVDYESEMWFDRDGRKLAANFNQWGHGQTGEHWGQFQAYLEDPEKNPIPDGYTAPFYKADRIAEYRQAHAAFTERMKGGGS